MSDRAAAALDTLLGGKATAKRIVDLRDGEDAEAIDGVAMTATGERELIDGLRRGRGPDVVVAAKLGASLLRALREHPVALVIVTGAHELPAIEGSALLGPLASVRVAAGKVIAVAHAREDLHGIVRALGADTVRLAIAPTPAWLPAWLAHAKLEVAGTVHARVLSLAWAQWAARSELRTVLVPVGVPEPALDRPRAPELDQLVAAHALERWTGPVFPSPRAIAIVLGGLRRGAPPKTAVPESTLALWAQARRALPVTGALVGMDRPDPRLPIEAPTAAFLAQRALLREAANRELARTSMPTPAAVAEDGIARATEVLANAPEELSDHESKVVLRGLGMQVTRQAVASSASGASGFAERIGFPVVLKALSSGLRRRTEVGAVELDLPNAAAVRRAYGTISDNVERRAPTLRLDGIIVAEHVGGGLDLHAGIIRLASGGHAVFARALAGETTLEPATAAAPLSETDALLLAQAVLSRIPVPALRRGSDPDVHPLAELLLRLSWLAERFGDRIHLVELRRVRLVGGERGYVILDARIQQRVHLEGT
jgi:ATP-grasp domain